MSEWAGEATFWGLEAPLFDEMFDEFRLVSTDFSCEFGTEEDSPLGVAGGVLLNVRSERNSFTAMESMKS